MIPIKDMRKRTNTVRREKTAEGRGSRGKYSTFPWSADRGHHRRPVAIRGRLRCWLPALRWSRRRSYLPIVLRFVCAVAAPVVDTRIRRPSR